MRTSLRYQRGWVAAAAKSLRERGSWTGRTHLHKHLFIVDVLGLADVPFDFELYHYGPYSFALDEAVAEMAAFGELDKEYSQPGYGPSYELTPLGEDALAELSPGDEQSAARIAQAIAGFSSTDLELIATCLWVELREGELDSEVVVPRVQEIKPKYTLARIRWAINKANSLRDSLQNN
jgi:uncharacterized protein YwgA